MKYIKKDLGSYKLHMIKTNKFKTIEVRISFRNRIKKEEITIRNILCNMLTYSTKNYSSKRDLIIKSQDLYSASLGAHNTRIGNYINMDISLFLLNDHYTEEGNYEEAMNFLKEVIYNPNVTDGKFDEKTLEIIKTKYRTDLTSIREDSSYYSMLRLFENMDNKSPISYRMCGYIEDIDKVTATNLYEYYKKMIDKDLLDIFVVGDIDFKETEKLIKSIFNIRTFKKERQGYYLPSVKARTRKKIVREEEVNQQSKLSIGCRMHNLTTYERNYPLTLYNIILGSGTDSKLFRKVREENSLCYYINSVPNKLDSVLYIRAGIDKNNTKRVVDLTNSCMNMMRKGKFSEDDINNAKEIFITAIDSILETEANIIESYYMMSLLGLDDLDTRIKKMKEVTKEEIIKVAKKIKMDTVYCLEGVEK